MSEKASMLRDADLAFGELHARDPSPVPCDAARSDRGVEEGEAGL